jgi:hypothetical protein
MIWLAGEDEAWAGEELTWTEEQAESRLLAEGEGSIPFRVTGVDLNGLGSIDHFDPGPFRLPGAGGCTAGQIKGFWQTCQGSLDPGNAARTAGSQRQIECQGWVGTRSSLGTTSQEDDGGKVRREPGQDIDRLHGERRQVFSIQRGKLAAHFQQERELFPGIVGDREAPGGCVRIGNPVIGNDVYVWKRREIKLEEVRIKTMQARRQGKGVWVGNHVLAHAEARKKPHGPGPESISGAQGHGGWIAAGFELPDLVVDVIIGAQAEIRRQGGFQWFARAESPFTHAYSIQAFGPKVKGFLC